MIRADAGGIILFQESADIQFAADAGEAKIQSCPVEQLIICVRRGYFS